MYSVYPNTQAAILKKHSLVLFEWKMNNADQTGVKQVLVVQITLIMNKPLHQTFVFVQE